MKKGILILCCFLLWLLLTWNLYWVNLVTGGVAAILAGLLFGNQFPDRAEKMLNPVRWLYLVIYLFIFIWEMTKANFDVAYRVLHPGLLIKPGIVRVRTKIQSEMGRVILANSITLTPGTFTIDLKQDTLHIHCLVVPATDLAEATEKIVNRFEPLLIKIFD